MTDAMPDLATLTNQEVARLAAHGWRVESQVPGQVIFVRGRRPNHVLHLILSICTLGLWLIVWAILGMFIDEERAILTVQANGETDFEWLPA